MTRNEDLPDIVELEAEIDKFLVEMFEAKDNSEFEMYRQMIKFNITLLKELLRR